MAAGASALPPPPGAGADSSQPSPPGAPPTDPQQGAAPSPPQPQMPQGAQMLIAAVNNLRAIAKAIPGTSQIISEINNMIRNQLAPKMMEAQHPGEPAAPPA